MIVTGTTILTTTIITVTYTTRTTAKVRIRTLWSVHVITGVDLTKRGGSGTGGGGSGSRAITTVNRIRKIIVYITRTLSISSTVCRGITVTTFFSGSGITWITGFTLRLTVRVGIVTGIVAIYITGWRGGGGGGGGVGGW